VEEGIVAGGGLALLRARANIKVKGDNPDQEAGIKIVLRAIEETNTKANQEWAAWICNFRRLKFDLAGFKRSVKLL
jgi:hypothetical protein